MELLANPSENLNFLKNWNNFWGIKNSTALQKIEIDRKKGREDEEEGKVEGKEGEKMEEKPLKEKNDRVTKRLSFIELAKEKKLRETNAQGGRKISKPGESEAKSISQRADDILLLEETEEEDWHSSEWSESLSMTDNEDSEMSEGIPVKARTNLDVESGGTSISLPGLPLSPEKKPSPRRSPRSPIETIAATNLSLSPEKAPASKRSPRSTGPKASPRSTRASEKKSRRNTPKLRSTRSEGLGDSLHPNLTLTTASPVSLTDMMQPNIPLPPLPQVSSSPTKLMSFIPSLVARHYHLHPKVRTPPMVESFYGKNIFLLHVHFG